MGGHLKAPARGAAQEGGGGDKQQTTGFSSLTLGHASSALAQTRPSTVDTHACFHPCLFPMCCRP